MVTRMPGSGRRSCGIGQNTSKNTLSRGVKETHLGGLEVTQTSCETAIPSIYQEGPMAYPSKDGGTAAVRTREVEVQGQEGV